MIRMQELINIESYKVENYKTDLQEFYSKIKLLFKELDRLNNFIKEYKSINETAKISDIHNEFDLRVNKGIMDRINTEYKAAIEFNNYIKKQLNNWKSNFAGIKGLDTLLTNSKEELLFPLKQKQIEYDQRIKQTSTLKEQAETKTTLGLREYKKIIIDEIIPLDVPMKYWLLNEVLVKEDIKKDPNIKINGIKFHIEVEIK